MQLRNLVRVGRFLCRVLFLLVVATCAGAAQERAALLSVTAQDPTGAVVPNARVVLLGPDGDRSATASADGVAVFRFLPPGTYELRVTHDGFAPVSLRDLVLQPNADVSRTVTLPVANLTEDVSVAGSTRYRAVTAESGTKTSTPLMETPLSIRVVPRAVIEDQKATQLEDVLENVSSVQAQPTLGLDSATIIRGFPNRNRTYRNGVGIVVGSAFGSFPNLFDTANAESVEVLKGPASVLYGRSEPGGLININTKRPLAVPSYSVEQRIGSYQQYRTEFDATGPVTRDGSLQYRLAGSYQNSESFRDFVEGERVLVNPSLTWRPTRRIDVTVDLEWFDQDQKADFGLPAIGRRPAPVPIGRSLDDPNTPLANSHHVMVGTDAGIRLADTWSLRSRFLTTHGDADSTFVNPAPAFGEALRADGRTLDRNVFFQEVLTDAYTTNLDATGALRIRATRHQVLVGLDYTVGYTDYRSRGDFITPDPTLAIDIFDPGPSYGIDAAVFQRAVQRVLNPARAFSVAKVAWTGLYFQDQVTVGDRLHLLAGGRFDWAEVGRGFAAESYDAAEANLPQAVRHDDQFSPRIGALYEVSPWLSAYGSWTKSFGANNGLSATGDPHPAESAVQYETGVKTEMAQGRLGATFALYHLTKQNILTPDLTTPDPADSIALGEARSRGFEMDASGQVSDDVQILVSYAFTDAEVTEDHSGNLGRRLTNVPRHAGSAWVKYDIPSALLTGLSLGVGVYAASERTGDLEDTFRLPGYGRLDALAAYRWRVGASTMTAQLNLRNLLDTEYYESTDQGNVSSRFGIYPGAPFTAIASIRVQF